MTYPRVRAIRLAGCILAAGAALAVPGTASAISQSAHSRPAQEVGLARTGHYYVLVGCTGQHLVRPRSYVIACGDGNDYLTSLVWASWGSSAFGTGTERINDCMPSCAAGTFHSYPALAVLWHARKLPHSGATRYARMTIIFSGNLPPGVGAATRTISLPG